jgi:hypothetical protein
MAHCSRLQASAKQHVLHNAKIVSSQELNELWDDLQKFFLWRRLEASRSEAHHLRAQVLVGSETI